MDIVRNGMPGREQQTDFLILEAGLIQSTDNALQLDRARINAVSGKFILNHLHNWLVTGGVLPEACPPGKMFFSQR